MPSKVLVGVTSVPVTKALPAVSWPRPTEVESSRSLASCGVTLASVQLGPEGWQVWPGLQNGAPGAQPPPWQVSAVVQASPSLHGVPLGWLVPPWQVPVAGLQVPPVVHWPPAQLTGFA